MGLLQLAPMINHPEFAPLDDMIAAAPETPASPATSAELIPINREGGNQSVNARDLHAFLKNGDHFATWIKERIQQFGFVEGSDFESYSAPAEKPTGGRPSKEYTLSIDMAKELSMVERTDKGKQARQYFIACEKALKEQPQLGFAAAMSDPATLRSLLLDNVEKVLALEATVSNLTPKADALDRIAAADGSFCITDAAKDLQIRPKDLTTYLSQNGWIYKRQGVAEWLAYQAKIQQGCLEAKVHEANRPDGTIRVCSQTRITAKGMTVLAKIFTAPMPMPYVEP
jgi:anti-repressor protein